MTTLNLANKADSQGTVRYDAEELFRENRYRSWKKGDVTNPRWLKRQNGSDFITISVERDLADLEKYLARDERQLAVEPYNVFTTGSDRNGNPMLVLSEMDAHGDTMKRAIIVVTSMDFALRVVVLADQFCGESTDE